MKKKDIMTELIQELAREAPGIKQVLVDERDFYIAQKILEQDCKKIVAVVGAGHVEGILQNLKKGKHSVKHLEKVAEKKSVLKTALKFGIPAVFAVFLIWGFYSKGFSGGLNVIAWWIIITGICSALGALLARAHPLAILTAFVAAPFTTLHPALASGWFAAAVEAKFKPPKVQDLETLNQLNSPSDFFRNQATRILLVAALTNIGST